MYTAKQIGCCCICHMLWCPLSESVVGETLVGILADWSDTQLKGLEDAIGQETVSKVMKGYQVGFNLNKLRCRVQSTSYPQVLP